MENPPLPTDSGSGRDGGVRLPSGFDLDEMDPVDAAHAAHALVSSIDLGEVEAHREALDLVEQWLGPAVVLRSQLGAMARRIQREAELGGRSATFAVAALLHALTQGDPFEPVVARCVELAEWRDDGPDETWARFARLIAMVRARREDRR